jgi:hypothetical protein
VRCGRSVADPPDAPMVVEASHEVAERLVEFLDHAESLQPKQLLLQRADESLNVAVALRLPEEGRGRLDGEGLELVPEGARDELDAVVVAELRFPRDPVLISPLREVHGLAEALDHFEARASQRGADAVALGGVDLPPNSG